MVGRSSIGSTVQHQDEKGVSLLEALVSLLIFLVVLFGVYNLYDASQTGYARGTTDIGLQDSGRNAQAEMAAITRSVGYDPTGAGIFGLRNAGGFVPIATESTLLFTLDANEDGVLANDSTERIGFALFGSDLQRTIDGVTPVAGLPTLARNVQSIQFSYFDASDTPIPNPPGAIYNLTPAEM
ncbi:MAG: prepilin-type N-terminal cleavage/methylation domain-containing protein, partial [candidate division NC10 bacterium]